MLKVTHVDRGNGLEPVMPKKLSKAAKRVWKNLCAGKFYQPRAWGTKCPKAMQELVDAGLVVEGGRVQVIGRYYVPIGTKPFTCEKFPDAARLDKLMTKRQKALVAD